MEDKDKQKDRLDQKDDNELVRRIAEQKYLLADSSKFERNGIFRFAQKIQFDEIITQ